MGRCPRLRARTLGIARRSLELVLRRNHQSVLDPDFIEHHRHAILEQLIGGARRLDDGCRQFRENGPPGIVVIFSGDNRMHALPQRLDAGVQVIPKVFAHGLILQEAGLAGRSVHRPAGTVRRYQ